MLQSNSPTAIQELVQRRFGTTDEMAVDNAKSSHFADIPFVEEEEEEENLDEEENEEDDALDVQEAGAVRTKNPARKDSGKDGASVEEGAEAEESLPPEDLLGRLHTERSLRNLLESKQKLVLSRADSMVCRHASFLLPGGVVSVVGSPCWCVHGRVKGCSLRAGGSVVGICVYAFAQEPFFCDKYRSM